MGLIEIAILFGSLMLVTSRTITVEKGSLSVIEESQELDDVTYDIIQTFLSSSDVTSGGLFDDSYHKCSKGWCRYCRLAFHHKGCFVAKIANNTIELEVTIDGKTFTNMTIHDANPPEVCKKEIPEIKEWSDICVQVKRVDLRNEVGCVYMYFRKHRNPKKHWFKISCFKIPVTEGEDRELQGESVDDMQDEPVLVFETAGSNS